MKIFILSLFTILAVGLFVESTHAQIKPAPSTVSSATASSTTNFCERMPTHISNLEAVETAFKNFYTTHSSPSAPGYDYELCMSAADLYEAACTATNEAKEFQNEYCETGMDEVISNCQTMCYP